MPTKHHGIGLFAPMVRSLREPANGGCSKPRQSPSAVSVCFCPAHESTTSTQFDERFVHELTTSTQFDERFVQAV
jgi:hypothetical protein